MKHCDTITLGQLIQQLQNFMAEGVPLTAKVLTEGCDCQEGCAGAIFKRGEVLLCRIEPARGCGLNVEEEQTRRMELWEKNNNSSNPLLSI